jgi:hypothetical protein
VILAGFGVRQSFFILKAKACRMKDSKVELNTRYQGMAG